MLAYLRLLVNENDSEALLRIMNYPMRGIGETTQNKLIVYADSIGQSIANVLDALSFHAPNLGINNSALTKLNDFWQMIKAFQVMLKTENVYQVAMEVAKKSGLIKSLKEDQTPEGISRVENIQELMNSMQGFIDEQQQLEDGDPSLSNFLENIALSADTQENDEDGDKVSLMTIHLSKGLEFPIVYIVGLEEGLFPSFMSSNSREELEEERRLFYVALTRAEKQAFFSYAVSRFQWGKITDSEPSRFLSEVDTDYLDFINPMVENRGINRSGLSSSIFDDTPSMPRAFQKKEPKKKLSSTDEQKLPEQPIKRNLTPVSSAKINTPDSSQSQDIEVGDRVRHNRFGVGEVLFLDGTDPNNVKAKIKFATEGEKNLILKFAKLEKIN